MVADRGKKPKIKDTDEEDSEQLDTDLVLSIEKLQELQDQLDKINEEASEEVLAVEQKHNVRRKPIYTKRDEVIKTIPDFWLTAFLSHPALCDLLSEEDAKIFKYLDSLEVEDFKDLKFGFSITFNFKPNPYFEDTKLTKTFTFFDEGTAKITGTNINWKKGMGPAANGDDGEKKGNKRPAPEDSFFSWFSETQQKDIAEGLNDEVAEIIKEDFWTNPLKYFHNEPDEEDSDGDEDEDDDEENGNDEEEEDDDDDDEDDDEEE